MLHVIYGDIGSDGIMALVGGSVLTLGNGCGDFLCNCEQCETGFMGLHGALFIRRGYI